MSGKIFYNKLIRDRIPEKIRSAGSECEVREMAQEEFERELLKKVGEEASGLLNVESNEELVRELADVIDVIEEIKRVKGISQEEIAAAQTAAMEKKGGFTKKLFLSWSSDDGYKTNETKG